MPEGPEIKRMAFVLDLQFAGLFCYYVLIMKKYRKAYNNELYSSMNLTYQHYDNYKTAAIGSKLTGVKSRGKKIIFEFDDPNTGFQGRFVSGCGLNGLWSLKQSPNTAIAICFGETFAFYEETYIGGNFSICLYDSPEYKHIFKDVGPDIMTDEVTWDIYYSIWRETKKVEWTVYDFMMEQKFISGNGNWITAEVLYESRINPKRLRSNLSDNDLWNMYNFNKKIVSEAYSKGGLTIRDYVDPLGEIGAYETKCYGREYDPNSYPIVKEENKKGRKMHYCPTLQQF